jgi:hypothetical protein
MSMNRQGTGTLTASPLSCQNLLQAAAGKDPGLTLSVLLNNMKYNALILTTGLLLSIGCKPAPSADFTQCVDKLKSGDSEAKVKELCGSPSLTANQPGNRVKFSYLRGPMDMRSDGLDITFESGALIEFNYFDPVSGNRKNLAPKP